MKLIILLVALAIGHLSSSYDRWRRFSWFQDHIYWIEKRISQYGIWDSAIGALLPLIIPCGVFLVALYALDEIWSLLAWVFSVIVLFVCLGREPLADAVDDFIDAHNENDNKGMSVAAEELTDDYSSANDDPIPLLSGLLYKSQDQIFGVIFWFIVLGPLGALIYRFSSIMNMRQSEIHGGFSDSVRNLNRLLDWPVTRLSVLGYAMVGSLMHTFETWRDFETMEFSINDTLLSECGLSAIQYSAESEETSASWLEEMQGLVNRALILWLALIALSTINGWFG